MTSVEQHRAAELSWVFRPEPDRPARIQALAGAQIHASGPVCADGRKEVVLGDGTRVRAEPAEIVAELGAALPADGRDIAVSVGLSRRGHRAKLRWPRDFRGTAEVCRRKVEMRVKHRKGRRPRGKAPALSIMASCGLPVDRV